MKLSHVVTVLVGVFLIVLIAPLSQFLTMMTVNLDLETASPVGWAVGIVFSIVLVLAVLRFLKPIVGKANLVILYTMLTISVPVMNIGMVRQCFLTMNAVMREYLGQGTSTYRTAYNVLSEDWFPLVPTREGVAYNKADRLLRLLRDNDVIKQREEARRKATSALLLESQRLTLLEQAEEARENAPDSERKEQLKTLLRDVPPQEAAKVLALAEPEALESLELEGALRDLAAQAEEDEPELPRTRTAADVQAAEKAVMEQLSKPGQRLARAIMREADRLDAIAAGRTAGQAEPSEEEIEELAERIRLMGPDQLEKIIEMAQQDAEGTRGAKVGEALERMGLRELLYRRKEQLDAQSEAAAEVLPGLLEDTSEFAASLLPMNYDNLDPDSRDRIDFTVEGLDQQRRSELMEQKQWIEEHLDEVRGKVNALSSSDYRSVVDGLSADYLSRYQQMEDAEFDHLRNSFVYRLTRQERQAIRRQDGSGGTPDQNLDGFNDSLWRTLEEQRRKQNMPWKQNVRTLFRDLPWHLWVRPMVMWGLLFTAIFLFLMCVAEWLRRKWVERENLAFPLVDVADGIIRHDWELEVAVDPREPPKRRMEFNPIFLLGLGIGLIWLTAEAAGHYGLVSKEYIAEYNVSSEVFKTGALKSMDKVQLVLSPIVIGIAFLVSLEISFSVWVLFFVYSIIIFFVNISMDQVPQDSVYTGWGAGRMFPFPMEQMLGAVVAFTAVTLYKSFRLGRRQDSVAEAEYFIPRRLNLVGLILLPVAILLLLWNMGFSPASSWFLALFGLLVMAQTIAAARVRAETGLPTHHCSYEYTKFPMVFGLTGATGAKAYALFANIVFLPLTLLFRTLPQHLENIELARRNKVKYRTIAVAGLAAFLVALSVGMLSFLAFSYYYGSEFYAGADAGVSGQGPTSSQGLAHYPLWVSHFLGEVGLDQFTDPHWVRIHFMMIGAGALLLLTFLRNRFLRFPFHPLGYMLLLLSVYYEWVSPYYKGGSGVVKETSWLWGSVLVAWVVKKLVVKYGGMYSYKRAKPFFIGLVVGAVMCIFLWNCVDLIASISAELGEVGTEGVLKEFQDNIPYSPSVY
ncbi:MAG: DUF6785 family protein [Phycisphaerae bacterium]